MARHTVCKVADVPAGKIVPATLGRARILLSRLESGEIKAFAGRCPHQGASLEFGCITDLTEAELPNDVSVNTGCKVLRCPWHGFEYSLETGRAVVADDRGKYLRLRAYAVEIDGEDVVVVT